ncbi:NUMOD3 domain-containing DNA-binding protein [Gammaproteobacteria bacterium]|nr:NUMOD3 domain-containing DNA-binding protein [Gammaproteobacteria bacterium]
MTIIANLEMNGDSVPVVHTFTDCSDSWNVKAHVASRIELIDVEQHAYVNYLTIFKPDDLIYAGYHERGVNEDVDGFYSGTVKKTNYLWQLRKDHPASDFMLIVYAGFNSIEESLDEEFNRIGLLWDEVGKHKDGGRCLNLARYRKHFHYDQTGSTRSEETKAKIGKSSTGRTHSEETKAKMSKSHMGIQAGNKNPMFGRTGESSPGFGKPKPEGAGVPPRPVIRTDTGQIFESLTEAARVEGVAANSVIINRIKRKNFNGIWRYLDEYQKEQGSPSSLIPPRGPHSPRELLGEPTQTGE